MYILQILGLLCALLLLMDIRKMNTGWVKGILLAGMLAGFIIHLVQLGFNLIFIPVYLLVFAALIVTLINSLKKQEKKKRIWKRIIGVSLSVILTVLCFGILYAFPKFSLPEPTGKYGIGSIEVAMTDPSRAELYTDNEDDLRKVMVQVWYPTSKNNSGDAMRYPVLSTAGVPPWLFSYFPHIKTNTYYNAEVIDASESFPLILFSPGNRSTRFQNIALVEQLVSNGYIVAGIDHPYTSYDVVFPDGTVALRDTDSDVGYNDVPYFEYEIDIRGDDAIFVLNELAAYDSSDTLMAVKERIDFNKIGFAGHSYGGATVADALSKDPRFKAGVSFDGGLWGTAAQQGINQPFLYMAASETLQTLEDQSVENQAYRDFVSTVLKNLAAADKKGSNDFYYLQMENYDHYSFTDVPLFSPLLSHGKTPLETTTALTLTFFNEYLKQAENADIQELSQQYYDIVFQRGQDIVFPQ